MMLSAAFNRSNYLIHSTCAQSILSYILFNYDASIRLFGQAIKKIQLRIHFTVAKHEKKTIYVFIEWMYNMVAEITILTCRVIKVLWFT